MISEKRHCFSPAVINLCGLKSVSTIYRVVSLSRSPRRGPEQNNRMQNFIYPYLEMLHCMYCPCQVTFTIPGVFFGVQQIKFDLSLNLGQASCASILLMTMICLQRRQERSESLTSPDRFVLFLAFGLFGQWTPLYEGAGKNTITPSI